MKSKILSYNQSQNNHSGTSNNSTNSSNRNRNSSKCSNNNKYPSVSIATKILKNNDNDKDMCNNNGEESIPEIDSRIIISKSLKNVSINNNSINDKSIESKCEHLLEDIKNLNLKTPASVDLCECNLNSGSSLSIDDEGNNTDQDMDNNIDGDEECAKSTGSIPENKTNLIVNYLPQNMSQEEMRLLFNNVGEVESCKLIRDKTTGQSLSYGFVNFQDARDASDAIHKFNGLRIQNKVIKVSLARPSSETIKGANLYICGLPKSMTQNELEQLFAQYGTIITCRILVDNVTGNSKGVAFIRFDRRKEAETAIKNLNGHTPPNGAESMTVKLANTPFNINNPSSLQLSISQNQNNEYSSPSPKNGSSMPPSNSVRCMMPNMRCPMVTTCSDMIPRLDVVLQNNGHTSSTALPQEYVQSSNVPMPNSHQMTFQAGQLVCPSQMHPMASFPISYPCLQSQGPPPVPINSNHPQSQYLTIDPITASTHILDSSQCCLMVYNLSPETKESSLWQTFGPYGAVHSVSLVRDPATGKCRGFGFVTMPNYHEALLAAHHLNGNSLDNQILHIAMNPGLKMSPINQYILPS